MGNTASKWSPKIDTRNMLDAKSPNRAGVMTDKPYMRTMYDIRSKLKLALNEIPDCPPVSSMDELFTEAEKVVHTSWQKHVSGLLAGHRTEWLKATEGNDELKELHDILSNDKIFEEKLRFFQLGPLEPLRTIAPEAWYQLLLASSERQMAQIWLLNHWTKKNQELPKAMGMTPEEVQLILDIGNLGKFVNMAFLKQTKLADTSGGSESTPLAGVLGADRVYEMYETPESEEYKVKTFGEVFKGEWPKVVEHLKRISRKTAGLFTASKLPKSYEGLPAHLDKMAETYGSSETDPDKLATLWQELDKSGKQLAENGCPVSVIGQACASVAGEANKTDIEIRVGLRDQKAEAFEKKMQSFHQSAQTIVDSKAEALSDSFTIPTPQVNRQLYFFGTNMVWETPADTREQATNVHYNTITKEGMVLKPVLDKILPENPLSEEDYKKAFVLDTGLHELAHGILPTEDAGVLERLGTTSEADIIEELKAEAGSFVILRDIMQKEGGVDVRAQVMAKLAVVMDYLLNKSSEEGSGSERYYYTGVAIVKELLDRGVLRETDGKYSIVSPEQVVEVVADLGEKILHDYYEDLESNAGAVTEKGKRLREAKSDPKVAAFLLMIQKLQAA